VRAALLALSLGIVVHVLLLEGPGIARAGRVLRHLHPAYIAAALSLEVASNATLAQLYRSTIAAAGKQVSYRRALTVSMGGFTVSRILPGGAATAALFMTRGFAAAGVASATAAACVVVAGTLAMLVLGGIVSVGALGSLARGDLSFGYVVAVAIVVSVLVGACALGVRMLKTPEAIGTAYDRLDSALRRIRIRLPAAMRTFAYDMASQLPRMRLLWRPALWSSVNWLTDIAALWLLFFALGYHIHLGVVVVGYGLANLLTALPITPGGLGLVEAGLAGTFTAFGVPGEISVVAVLGYRLVSYWLPVIAGIPPYIRGVNQKRLDPAPTGAG
jgi:uncharacterized protein (TIRG00374 family)